MHLPGDLRRSQAFAMQLENAVAVDAGFSPHADAIGFRLQSALVGALQDSFPLRLGDCRKDDHHHPSHLSFSSDAVVQKADSHAVLVELLDQPDHVSSVVSQPVEFPDQDHVAIFHLQLQCVEARALERTSAHLVGEDAVRFHACFLQNAHLAVQGLLVGRYAGVAEQSHASELSIKWICGHECPLYAVLKI